MSKRISDFFSRLQDVEPVSWYLTLLRDLDDCSIDAYTNECSAQTFATTDLREDIYRRICDGQILPEKCASKFWKVSADWFWQNILFLIMKLEKVIYLIRKILMWLTWIFITSGKHTFIADPELITIMAGWPLRFYPWSCILIRYRRSLQSLIYQLYFYSLDLIPFIGKQDCIFDASKNPEFNVFKACLSSEKDHNFWLISM